MFIIYSHYIRILDKAKMENDNSLLSRLNQMNKRLDELNKKTDYSLFEIKKLNDYWSDESQGILAVLNVQRSLLAEIIAV